MAKEETLEYDVTVTEVTRISRSIKVRVAADEDSSDAEAKVKKLLEASGGFLVGFLPDGTRADAPYITRTVQFAGCRI